MAGKLLCYDFEIRKKADKELRDLYIFDNKHDFLDVAWVWFDTFGKEVFKSPNQKRTIHRNGDSKLEKFNRCIIGQWTVGKTGTGSEIVDSGTLKTKAHKEPSDLDTIALMFLVYIPQKGRFGKLMFQHHDGLNASTCVNAYLRHRFAEDFDKYKLEIKPAVFTDIIDEFIKTGDLIEVELKRRVSSKEEIDRLNPDISKFNNPFITVSYTADRGAKRLKRSVVSAIRRIYEKKEAKVFLNMDFDDASLTLEIGDKQRKIPMSSIYSRANAWPLKEDISLDTDMVPIYEEVKQEAIDLVKATAQMLEER